MMEKNLKICKFLLILLSIILFFNLFVLNIFYEYRWGIVLFLIIYFCVFYKILNMKKYNEKNNKSNNKYIYVWAIVFGVVFLLINYTMGLLYNINFSKGFFINPIKYLSNSMINRIIPYIFIIIFSELIRKVIIVQNDNKLLTWLTIDFILVDIVININIYTYSSFLGIFELIGCLIIPAITINLLFNYMTRRFGGLFNIIYRFITIIIYTFCMPILPDIYPIVETFIELLYPYIMYIVIEWMFFNNESEEKIIKEK